MTKEQNFVSAVITVNDDEKETINFLQSIYEVLNEHFFHFEIIAVNTLSHSNPAERLRDWGNGIDAPVTMIHMSLRQTHEQCMNAGIDCAIGDYIYEFDDTAAPIDKELIWNAYKLSQEGNDIVAVCPTRIRLSSRAFYYLFNAHSEAAYPLRTDTFYLVTRRAENRAHTISQNLPYRKAAYATCGLKMAELEFDGESRTRNQGRFELASDSLVLYTNFGYKLSLILTFLMLAVTLAEMIYTLVIWRTGHPVQGWTTTMFVLTLGMTGLFAILAILLKYMTLLLKIVFHKQSYLIEGTEKI